MTKAERQLSPFINGHSQLRVAKDYSKISIFTYQAGCLVPYLALFCCLNAGLGLFWPLYADKFEVDELSRYGLGDPLLLIKGMSLFGRLSGGA